jgi:hypothetical protein
MRRALLAFAIALSSTVLNSAVAETTLQRVNLAVVSRCGASVVLEKATLVAEDGRPAADIPLKPIGPYFYAGQVTAAPGTYHVGVSKPGPTIKTGCWGGAKLTVLPGHDRNVGIEVVEIGGAHYDAYAFIYGTLPFGGFVRGTLVGKRFEQPVDIDNNAYYVEHAFPGNYLLKLYYSDALECRVQIAIPENGLRYDISVHELQQCFGFPYHFPSTGESGFIRIFASPSPPPSPSSIP